jgi:Zn-dependent peptidase ImmA (M78 family)
VSALPEVDVLFVPGLPACGMLFPRQSTICIRSGQTRRMRRSVLAHELAHYELAHQPHPDRGEERRMENRACRWAARHLISLADLAAAARSAGSWDEVAERLEVDVRMLRARVADLTAAEQEWLAGQEELF